MSPTDLLGRAAHVATLTLSGTLDAAAVAVLSDACEKLREAPVEDAPRVLVLRSEPQLWRGWAAETGSQLAEQGLIGDPFGALAELRVSPPAEASDSAAMRGWVEQGAAAAATGPLAAAQRGAVLRAIPVRETRLLRLMWEVGPEAEL